MELGVVGRFECLAGRRGLALNEPRPGRMGTGEPRTDNGPRGFPNGAALGEGNRVAARERVETKRRYAGLNCCGKYFPGRSKKLPMVPEI
jgi:hypothetical protein